MSIRTVSSKNHQKLLLLLEGAIISHHVFGNLDAGVTGWELAAVLITDQLRSGTGHLKRQFPENQPNGQQPSIPTTPLQNWGLRKNTNYTDWQGWDFSPIKTQWSEFKKSNASCPYGLEALPASAYVESSCQFNSQWRFFGWNLSSAMKVPLVHWLGVQSGLIFCPWIFSRWLMGSKPCPFIATFLIAVFRALSP